MEQDQKHYYAFISHSSKDEKIAKWLCKQLEGYHIPTAIQKEYHAPKRLKPIFLYEIDLSKNVLKRALESELFDSQYLIVICSPAAAKSSHVNEEVLHFIHSGRYDKIIPFIIDGTPFASLKGSAEEECFPPALVALKGTEQELRGIDIREEKKHRGSKKAAVIDVIASMLGVRMDVLKNRHDERERIINLSISAAILLSIITFVGVASHIYNLHYSQIINESVSISNDVLKNLNEGNIFSAEVLALEAYEQYPKASNTEKALRAVYDSISLYNESSYKLFETIHYASPPRIVKHMPSKNCFIVVCEEKIYVYNAQNCLLENEINYYNKAEKIEFSINNPNIIYLFSKDCFSIVDIQNNQVMPYLCATDYYRIFSVSDHGVILQKNSDRSIEIRSLDGTVKQSMGCDYIVDDAVYNVSSNCLAVIEERDYKKEQQSFSIYDCLSGKCLRHEKQKYIGGAQISFNLSSTELFLCKYDSIISYNIKNKDKIIRHSYVNRSNIEGLYLGNDMFLGDKEGNIIISTKWGHTIDSIKAHNSYIRDLSISYDERQIITCCNEESNEYDYTVKVWQRKYIPYKGLTKLDQNYFGDIDRSNYKYTLLASKGYFSLEKQGTFILNDDAIFRYREDITAYEDPVFLNDGKHVLYRKTRYDNEGMYASTYIYKWDYISNTIVDSMDVSGFSANKLLASSDGKYFLYYGSHCIYVLKEQYCDTLSYLEDYISDLVLSTDNKDIAILLGDSIVIYDIDSALKQTVYLLHTSCLDHICMNGNYLYVSDYSELYMINRNTKNIINRIECAIGRIEDIFYDRQNDLVYVRGDNNEIRLFSSDLTSYGSISTIGHVNSIFPRNNQIIAVGTNLLRYDMPKKLTKVDYLYCFCNERFVCYDHQGVGDYFWGNGPRPSSIEFDDSDWPISVSLNPIRNRMAINFHHDIKIVNIPRKEDEKIRIIEQYENDSIRNITYNVYKNVIYYAKINDNKLYEWDYVLDRHKILTTLPSNISSICCSNDCEFTAIGTKNGLYLMDNYSYRPKKIYTYRNGISSIVLDENDKRIAVCSSDGKILIMDIKGRIITSINGIANYSDLLCFVGDNYFATNTERNRLNVYDIASNMIIATYPILYHSYDCETLQYDSNYNMFRLGYREIMFPTIEEILSTLKHHINGRKLSEDEKQKYGYRYHRKWLKWYF